MEISRFDSFSREIIDNKICVSNGYEIYKMDMSNKSLTKEIDSCSYIVELYANDKCICYKEKHIFGSKIYISNTETKKKKSFLANINDCIYLYKNELYILYFYDNIIIKINTRNYNEEKITLNTKICDDIYVNGVAELSFLRCYNIIFSTLCRNLNSVIFSRQRLIFFSLIFLFYIP